MLSKMKSQSATSRSCDVENAYQIAPVIFEEGPGRLALKCVWAKGVNLDGLELVIWLSWARETDHG